MQLRIKPGEYTTLDRYKDFSTVKNSDAGNRMISEIINICDVKTFENEANDAGKLAFRAGKRYVALWILGILTHRPTEK